MQQIINGLQNCFAAAFNRAQGLFVNKIKRQQAASIITEVVTPNQIQIVLDNITVTGHRNKENTKNVVNLRYYVINNNSVVNADYAADSINLLDKQEMAQILNQDVEVKGYVEVKPRTSSSQDSNLWIIGAVLGPLLFLCLVFWIVLFIYYKCINPRTKQKSQTNPSKEDYKVIHCNI